LLGFDKNPRVILAQKCSPFAKDKKHRQRQGSGADLIVALQFFAQVRNGNDATVGPEMKIHSFLEICAPGLAPF
jgi:hypothetical protein